MSAIFSLSVAFSDTSKFFLAAYSAGDNWSARYRSSNFSSVVSRSAICARSVCASPCASCFACASSLSNAAKTFCVSWLVKETFCRNVLSCASSSSCRKKRFSTHGPSLFAHSRLHSVKKFLCNQRLVSSLKYLSLVFHQSGVEDVLEEGVRLADGHIVAEERFEFLVLAPLAQFAQVVVSGCVEFKEFFDFCCLVLVYVNPARLGVIEIAEWCKHRPDAVANFLPHTSRDVLAEIVYIIFALAERNLEHKQSLRRRFKPKRRKFEGTNQAAIYHMYDFASVYTVAS